MTAPQPASEPAGEYAAMFDRQPQDLTGADADAIEAMLREPPPARRQPLAALTFIDDDQTR